MDGIQSQIENSSEELYNVAEDDFIDLMKSLTKIESDKSLTFITGIGGLLNFVFQIWGRRKLPRKMKKHIYFTKKLRKQYIPQYYKTK
tara:strand:- start:2751 stop:3014 length:264 start_codon:yes stop_codon:yes gene_type:complete